MTRIKEYRSRSERNFKAVVIDYRLEEPIVSVNDVENIRCGAEGVFLKTEQFKGVGGYSQFADQHNWKEYEAVIYDEKTQLPVPVKGIWRSEKYPARLYIRYGVGYKNPLGTLFFLWLSETGNLLDSHAAKLIKDNLGPLVFQDLQLSLDNSNWETFTDHAETFLNSD